VPVFASSFYIYLIYVRLPRYVVLGCFDGVFISSCSSMWTCTIKMYPYIDIVLEMTRKNKLEEQFLSPSCQIMLLPFYVVWIVEHMKVDKYITYTNIHTHSHLYGKRLCTVFPVRSTWNLGLLSSFFCFIFRSAHEDIIREQVIANPLRIRQGLHKHKTNKIKNNQACPIKCL
jgi:hypothetical protein